MKKILLIIGLLLLTVLIASCDAIDKTLEKLLEEDYHVLYLTKSEEEAEKLAKLYNIDFLYRTDLGLTAYATKSLDQYGAMLESGFGKNELVELAASTGESTNYGYGETYYADQYGIIMTNIDDAWAISSGEGITIAVIDTGIDTDHNEFQGRISELSYNSRTKIVGLEAVEDDSGHGTMVAGVIASGDNGYGVIGVAPHAEILAIKANYENKQAFRASYFIEAILYATEVGVDIINASVAFTSYNSTMDQAVQNAVAAGILFVAASGNTGSERAIYPAAFDNVISVGSLNSKGEIDGFSTFHETLDFAAPGSSIIMPNMDGKYISRSGTSFAAPHVAGIAALMLQVYPNLTPAEIEQKLRSGAVDKGEPGFDKKYGYGMVDAYASIASDLTLVIFNTYGGTTIESIMLVPGGTFEIPEVPLKEHYEFAGWYRDTGFTESWVNSTVVNSSITLYAKWVPVEYTATYIVDGTTYLTETISYGEYLSQVNPEKEGYTFVYWLTNELEVFDITSELMTKDTLLTALFTVNSYTIIYVNSDGSAYEIFTYEYGTDLSTHTTPAGPTRTNYTFDSWSLIPTGTMGAENIYIYPSYERILNTVIATVTFSVVYEDGTTEVITIEISDISEIEALLAQYNIVLDIDVEYGEE
jgi:uncharacterized repeat protein (TIGR02543 family)